MPLPITVEVKGLTKTVLDLRGRGAKMKLHVGWMTRSLSEELHENYVENLSGVEPSTNERLLPVGVRSGTLRSRAKAVIINQYAFREENDTPWAQYIEWGTRYMTARAPMRAAKEKMERSVPGKMGETMVRGWPVR
jgi:hypothetical protein